VDIIEYHVKHIKNHTLTNYNREEAAEHKPRATQYTNNTEKLNKLTQTLGNHQFFQNNCIPEEPTRIITQKQSTKYKQTIPHHETLVPPVSPPLRPSEEAAIFILTPTNHKQRAAPRHRTS
jgi:hypothetical protein